MTTSTTRKTKRGSMACGPKTLTGSRDAKRQAAVLLEVLSGVRGPQSGSQALGVSLSRYYALETRALQGLISALEPRAKGRRKGPEQELDELRRDKRRLEQELGRSHALLRATQRSMGIPSHAEARTKRGKLGADTVKTKRRRRRVVRATKAIAVLRAGTEEVSAGAVQASDVGR